MIVYFASMKCTTNLKMLSAVYEKYVLTYIYSNYDYRICNPLLMFPDSRVTYQLIQSKRFFLLESWPWKTTIADNDGRTKWWKVIFLLRPALSLKTMERIANKDYQSLPSSPCVNRKAHMEKLEMWKEIHGVIHRIVLEKWKWRWAKIFVVHYWLNMTRLTNIRLDTLVNLALFQFLYPRRKIFSQPIIVPQFFLGFIFN